MSDATEIVTNDFNITDGYICTLDRTTDNGKVAIAKALNGSEPLKNHMDEVLHLAGVITTPGTRSQTGAECTNNYLVLDDGTVLFSQSDGVTRSLKVIAALWSGDLHDGKTIDVKCITQNLTNGNTLKTIVPV
jgi:hypothetical protein